MTVDSMTLLAVQATALQAAFDAAKNLGEFGSRYDHSKISDFQVKSNALISTMYPSGGGPSKLNVDGAFGTNTAARIMSLLTTAAPGLPNMPVSAASVPTWWISVRAAVTDGATARIAQLTSAVGQHAPANITGDAAAGIIDSATQTPVQTVADIAAQSATNGPAGTSTTNAGGSAGGGPVQLPAEYITAAPPHRGLSWPWVVGGIGLVALAGWALFGAKRRHGATKRRRVLVRT